MKTVKNNTVTVNCMEQCTLGGRYTHSYILQIEKMSILKINYFGHYGHFSPRTICCILSQGTHHGRAICWMHGKEIQLV